MEQSAVTGAKRFRVQLYTAHSTGFIGDFENRLFGREENCLEEFFNAKSQRADLLIIYKE